MTQRVEDIGAGAIEETLDALQTDLGVARADILAALRVTDKELAS